MYSGIEILSTVCVHTLTQTAARDPDSVTVSHIQGRDPHLFGGFWGFNITVKILCCLCVCGWIFIYVQVYVYI